MVGGLEVCGRGGGGVLEGGGVGEGWRCMVGGVDVCGRGGGGWLVGGGVW